MKVEIDCRVRTSNVPRTEFLLLLFESQRFRMEILSVEKPWIGSLAPDDGVLLQMFMSIVPVDLEQDKWGVLICFPLYSLV